MANNLDLEEQEQLDQLKHFWKQYGNWITWLLILVLGAFAGWNFYQRWQQNQASQAAALYDELERVANAGDITKLDRVMGDMKEKFSSTTYAHQGALLAARVYFQAGKIEPAKASLSWVAEKSPDAGYQAIARLRLAAVSMESKSYDDALKQLGGAFPDEFAALVADRKGDIFSLQGKKAESIAEYEKAYKSLGDRAEYRRLVEVKLNSLGVNPRTDATPAVMESKK
jgi:predicted negative regulator of RcsB-dependent stress response